MNTRLVLSILFIIPLTNTFAQDGNEVFDPLEKFPADSIKSWTLDVMDEVSQGHPGFYRYTSESRFDFLIDSTLQTVTDSLSTLEFYRKIKPLFAQIGCLHTSVALSEKHENHIKKRSKLFPFSVFIDQSKQVFITENHSENKRIPLKSEIISINERPISDILDILYKAIPSDGYNQTLKTLLLNYRFSFWYQSMIKTTDSFLVEIQVDNQTNTYSVQGVSENSFHTFESIEHEGEEQLKFKIEDGIGYLTIHSFAKTQIKKNGQKFNAFIEQTIKTLNQGQIENLVIDLRNNTGGTDGNAVFLASHFFDQPFKYWKNQVEMTEYMAEQFKIWYSIFYKMPEKKDSTYYWKGAQRWLTTEFNYYKTQKPAKDSYHGNVYLVTNGACMSSCADVAAILQHNNKATVIGQETGGGYQGNTSGMMPTENIYANLQMTIPLQKYTNAVDSTKNIGRGTMPDYPINLTLEEYINEKDTYLEYVKDIIQNNSRTISTP